MQGRMKHYQLTAEEIADVLNKADVGRIGLNDPNGFPYIVPVHFVVIDGKIYIHGLIKGQKIEYLKRDAKVGFEVDEMGPLIISEGQVCDTNTSFRSVIILGTAQMVDDVEMKNKVLREIVKKFTPQMSELEFPDKMIRATGVIEITVLECTGKYYK